MGFFSTKIEEEIVAVLDISSGSVSGAIFLKHKKKLPFILTSFSQELRLRDNVNADRLRKEIFGAIDRACLELQKRATIKPSKIYCILSTPWAHGELRSINIHREKEFQFTEVYAQDLIKTEINKLQTEIGQDTEVIDKKITKVSLNGYIVKAPHRQRTTKAKLDIFLSLANKNLIHDIEDKIHKTFKSKIFFTSQMLADFIFIRDAFSTPKDFLIINVGSEITEITFSKNEYLGSTAFLPHGINNLVRNVAMKLGKTVNETESLFRLYLNNSLDIESEKKVGLAVKFAIEIWQSDIKKVFLEIFPNRHLPDTIFLLSPDETAQLLASKMALRDFPEFTAGLTEFDVTIVDTKILHDFYDKAQDVLPNSNILIKTIYINEV